MSTGNGARPEQDWSSCDIDPALAVLLGHGPLQLLTLARAVGPAAAAAARRKNQDKRTLSHLAIVAAYASYS
jgi:hypothetical protein